MAHANDHPTPEAAAAVCAHEGCRCRVEAGQSYCSPHCVNVGAVAPERREERCACGHAACSIDPVHESR